MRHLLNLMTSRPLLMTVESHQSCYNALSDYYRNPDLFFSDDESETDRAETFCHVSVFGPTTHRFNGLDANCNRVRCYRDIRREIQIARQDASVKNIFVEFDGPGGEASGCFDLADFIAEVAKTKPVIGLINGVSYSANYAIASACTELYITPYSSGGSIGAIYGREERTVEGRKITYFTSGEAKADGQPFTELTDAESKRHQESITAISEQFFSVVASRRNIDAQQVKNLQANIFPAQKMLDLGLVDGIKTEEEFKAMMTDAKHQRIVNELSAKHEVELSSAQQKVSTLTEQITVLQAEAKENLAAHTALLKEVDQLAQAHGVGDISARVVSTSANLEEAKAKIKAEAASRSEEISLTTSVDDVEDSEAYDMAQLIKDA